MLQPGERTAKQWFDLLADAQAECCADDATAAVADLFDLCAALVAEVGLLRGRIVALENAGRSHVHASQI
jgi:hypothetical protein